MEDLTCPECVERGDLSEGVVTGQAQECCNDGPIIRRQYRCPWGHRWEREYRGATVAHDTQTAHHSYGRLERPSGPSAR